MIELSDFDREFLYLRDYARQNGDTAALRIAADEVVKLRQGYVRLAEHVQHEEGTDVVETVIRKIAELEAEGDALRARVAYLETEVDRHRERANTAELAWEGHQGSDCAIKCAREIEELLGTDDPIQAARAIKTLQTEHNALRTRLAEVEAGAAKMREALEYIYKAADWDRLRSSDAYYTGLFLTPAQEHRVHCIVAEALSANRALAKAKGRAEGGTNGNAKGQPAQAS